MRAGAFSEKRVIDLLNRRFVSFFFNRSGHGEGDDKDAREFTTGKTKNPYAYYACFTPDGEIVGETALYADKDAVFFFLQRMLAKNRAFAKMTAEEKAVLAGAKSQPESAAKQLAAARMLEELGRYDPAIRRYERCAQQAGTSEVGLDARRALLRIARYRRDWDGLEKRITSFAAKQRAQLATDIACERGYALLEQKEFARARALLQGATKTARRSPRLGELHFSAGRACWFLGDRDWAKFHWCWVCENIPDSLNERRCYIAAAAEAMPYANPELGGFTAPVGNIGTSHIVRGYRAAREIYRKLLPAYEAGDLMRGSPPKSDADTATKASPPRGPAITNPDLVRSPFLLIARLRDGKQYREDNERIVARLAEIGRSALAPLKAAVEDHDFPGRGFAAWALSQVLRKNKLTDEAAIRLLERARDDADRYVARLSREGLETLDR